MDEEALLDKLGFQGFHQLWSYQNALLLVPFHGMFTFLSSWCPKIAYLNIHSRLTLVISCPSAPFQIFCRCSNNESKELWNSPLCIKKIALGCSLYVTSWNIGTSESSQYEILVNLYGWNNMNAHRLADVSTVSYWGKKWWFYSTSKGATRRTLNGWFLGGNNNLVGILSIWTEPKEAKLLPLHHREVSHLWHDFHSF